MAHMSNKEFLEKSSVHTLLAYSRNPNIDPIQFHCMDVGAVHRSYSIPRDEVLAELNKREHVEGKADRRGRPSSDKKKLKFRK